MRSSDIICKDTFFKIMSGCRDAVIDAVASTSPKPQLLPTLRVGGRVAEEVEEEGLGEGVELGEGGAALGPQRLRPVQHLRNPPLLRQRRQENFKSSIPFRDSSSAYRSAASIQLE